MSCFFFVMLFGSLKSFLCRVEFLNLILVDGNLRVFVLGLGWGFGFLVVFFLGIILLVKVIFLFLEIFFIILVLVGVGYVVFFFGGDFMGLSLDFIFWVVFFVEFNIMILGIWGLDVLGVVSRLEKEIGGRVFLFFLVIVVEVFVGCFFGVSVCVLGLFSVVVEFLYFLYKGVGVVFGILFRKVVVVKLI